MIVWPRRIRGFPVSVLAFLWTAVLIAAVSLAPTKLQAQDGEEQNAALGEAAGADAGKRDLTAWLRMTNPDALEVKASSIGWGADNTRVVDGNTEGDYHVWNHTRNGPDEWLQVDLGAEYRLSRVELFNRNAHGARLNGAIVELRDAAGKVVAAFEPITGARDGSLHNFTAGKSARYVRIRHSNQYLHLTEVKVFGSLGAVGNGVASSASPDASAEGLSERAPPISGTGNKTPETLASDPKAVATSPEVRTEQEVYPEPEWPPAPITILFQNLPDPRRDWLGYAKLGDPDNSRVRSERPGGVSSGSKEMPGPAKPGSYEARLWDGKTGEVLARFPFTVGQNCLNLDHGTKPCSPSVRTNKARYAPGEPIEVFFEGAPGSALDWIGIDRKTAGEPYQWPRGRYRFGAPDKRWRPWAAPRGTLAGTQMFEGLAEGEYEVQLYARRTDIIARSSFIVSAEQRSAQLAVQDLFGDPESPASERPSAASLIDTEFTVEVPPPGIEGAWLGHIACKARGGEITNTASTILNISGEGKLTAELFILWPGADGEAMRLTGEHDTGTGDVSLEAKEWIYPPPGWAQPEPVGLSTNLDRTQIRMKGEILNAYPDCVEFQAVKFKRDERSPYERGVVPSWQKYQEALAHEGTCIPFLKWTTEGKPVRTQGTEIPSQVLDADTFYAVMGRSYDLWTESGRAAYESLWSRCVSKLRGNSNIATSSVIEKALKNKELSYFLAPGAPPAERPNTRQHYDYLAKYARVVALRNARLYADLQLKEAGGLPDTRENLNRLVIEIADVAQAKGVFVALPEDEKQTQVASLTAVKERMSGVLVDAAFSTFDLNSYPDNLEGLKVALWDRQSMESDAATYATSAQVAALKQKFEAALAPLSHTVVNQTIAAMPTLEATVEGFVAEKKRTDEATRRVVPYLHAPDQTRLTEIYEQRKVEGANRILPEFPEWLRANISPNRAGRERLEELSRAMLDIPPADLGDQSFAEPYTQIAEAITERHELLKYQICELPAGFEDLKEVICPEAVSLEAGEEDKG